MTTTRSVVIEKELPHPPEKIWRALTEGALIKEWLMDNDFQPTVGHQFQFRSTPVPNWNGVIDCEVKVVEANRSFPIVGARSGWKASWSGRWSRPQVEHSYAWSTLASFPIRSRLTRARP